MSKKYELYNDYKIAFETPDDGFAYFFGYYDKSPLNFDSTKLLSHRVAFDGRDVQDGDTAEIGYFDLNTKEFIKLDETMAWNWQQGSQLQWLPPKYDEEIIYNNILDNKFVSIIYNINTNKKRVIPFSIYVVHPNGKEALGVNYERHYWCRPGYNYQNIKNKKWDKPYHKEDGIYKIDLVTGEVNLLVKIVDIVNTQKLPEFDICNNWLEHLMYNPSGDRFMFFHRWNLNLVDVSRVYIANSIDGLGMHMLPDNKFYSHYYWLDNTHLTIWTNHNNTNTKVTSTILDLIKKNNILKKYIKPVFKSVKIFIPKRVVNQLMNVSKLVCFEDKTANFNVILDNKLPSNGHQSCANEELLIDSYQDESNNRNLFIYSLKTEQQTVIGKFYSSYNNSGYRCDLHPKMRSKKQVIIDVAYTYKRKQIILIKE